MSEWLGAWVEVDVPAVEGIGPAYTTRGRVIEAKPGHLLIIDCMDGEEHWRRPEKVRSVSDKDQEVRRYRCGLEAENEDTCERCPHPDGCIDFADGPARSVSDKDRGPL